MRAKFPYALVLAAASLLVGIVAWQRIMSVPDPTLRTTTTAAAVDVGILVFREGLECVLVLTAITASMAGGTQPFGRPVALGAALAFGATLLTWRVAVAIVTDLGDSIPALQLQAITGLLAIVVLVVIMNWFFHKVYWTRWISLHTNRKRRLVMDAEIPGASRARLLWGFGLLGFTSLYREGFEVVLFLQSYRLKLGERPAHRNGGDLGVHRSPSVALQTHAHRHRDHARGGPRRDGRRRGPGDAARALAEDDEHRVAEADRAVVGRPLVFRLSDRRDAGRSSSRDSAGRRLVLRGGAAVEAARTGPGDVSRRE
jgi:high-affinity iron transporter